MGHWGSDLGAVERARAKPLRWDHLAQFRSNKGPVWLQQNSRGGVGRGREEGDKDREVEGDGVVQGLLEAIVMALAW